MGRRSTSSLQRNFQIIYVDTPPLNFGGYFTVGSYIGQWLFGSIGAFSPSISHLIVHFLGRILAFFLEEFSIIYNLGMVERMAIPRNYLSLLFPITDAEEIKSCPHPNICLTMRSISRFESHMHDAKMEAGTLVISWPHLSYPVSASKPPRFPCFLFLKPISLAYFQFCKLLISFQLIPFLFKRASAHVCCLQPRGWQMKMFYSCLPTQPAQLFASFNVFHNPWKCLLEMPHSQRAHSVGSRWHPEVCVWVSTVKYNALTCWFLLLSFEPYL